MITLSINGNTKEIINKLFSMAEDGNLNFGLSGQSINPAEINDITNKRIEFKDYIMEGFVKYKIKAENIENKVNLCIELQGTNRDQYILSQIKFYVSQAGYTCQEIKNV